MRITMYKNRDGGVEMISHDRAIDEIRELGHQFAVSLAELGHDTNDNSDLMSGLAAYHMLKLEGVNPRIDAAHRVIIRAITDGVRAAQ